jgi:DHA1 family multidrug resistance protein-like MFS transporter
MHTSWKVSFACVLSAEVLATMAFSLSFPMMPLYIEDELAIHDPQKVKLWVGLIQSAAAVTMAVFAPIWGHLADVYSPRLMMMRAFFGGAVVISFMGIATAPWQVMALRALQGCVTGTIAAATVTTAAVTPKKQVAFALGLLTTGVAVGNSIGPLIGGIVGDLFGHRIAFFSTGILLACAGLVTLLGVQDPPHWSRKEGGKERTSLFADLKLVFQSSSLLTLLFVAFSVQAANTIAEPMMPLWVQHLCILNNQAVDFVGTATGVILGLGAGSIAVASTVAGKTADRVGYWRALLIALAFGAVFRVPQALVTTVYSLGVWRVLASFFIGAAQPVIMAIIANSVEKGRQGAVYGLFQSVVSTGGAIGPVIGSAVAMLALNAVFIATAIVLGVSAVLVTIRRLRR